MNNPLVSIIIPTYNRAHLIGETLDSVLVQTYQNWECIIVDDGSTDDTVEVVNNYVNKDARFQLHYRPIDRLAGGNAARNYGFEVSKGEYVNWLDSDDIMDNDCLLKKVNYLNLSPNYQALITNVRYSNYQFTNFRESKFQLVADVSTLLFLYGTDQIELQTSVFLWKRSFLINQHLFEEGMQRYQDNEFHIRMIAQLDGVVMKSDILTTIRGGNGDVSQISSDVNLTPKKLMDIFKYRYASLKLFNLVSENRQEEYINIVSRKTIWAFYLALRSNTRFLGRVSELYKYRESIQKTLIFKESLFLNRLKSYLYLCKIVILR